MGALNRVQLIGNLGKDPELRYTPDGTPVCNFSIATSESWTSKAGEKQEATEWHRISMWGKLGETAAQYLKKGRQVYVEGSIRSREYTNKEGQKATAYEIRGDKLVMLNSGEPRAEGSAPYQKPAPKPAAPAQAPLPMSKTTGIDTANSAVGGQQIDDADLPF
jgi:single-strand DNA-binding protein